MEIIIFLDPFTKRSEALLVVLLALLLGGFMLTLIIIQWQAGAHGHAIILTAVVVAPVAYFYFILHPSNLPEGYVYATKEEALEMVDEDCRETCHEERLSIIQCNRFCGCVRDLYEDLPDNPTSYDYGEMESKLPGCARQANR